MLGIQEMKDLGAPVTIDATHAVQRFRAPIRSRTALPRAGGGRGFDPGEAGCQAGVDGVFLEFHHDPREGLARWPSLPYADRRQGVAHDAESGPRPCANRFRFYPWTSRPSEDILSVPLAGTLASAT